MQKFESMDDAVQVAREVLAGKTDPYLGCGLIGAIGRQLNYPVALQLFTILAHEQTGHEHLGITAESCLSDILAACRDLVGLHSLPPTDPAARLQHKEQ